MISYLKWEILNLESDRLSVLTSSWVWYEVFINERIFSKLIGKKEISLFIYHHISESSQSLYWFLDNSDKDLFKELIKISWIWWKVAILILNLEKQELAKAVHLWDTKIIESVKWIGKKWAQKIVLELKDKEIIKNEKISDLEKETNLKKSNIDISTKESVISSLSSMWYEKRMIEKTLDNLPEDLKDINQIIAFIIKNIWK